jgi:hypothetical protein
MITPPFSKELESLFRDAFVFVAKAGSLSHQEIPAGEKSDAA